MKKVRKAAKKKVAEVKKDIATDYKAVFSIYFTETGFRVKSSGDVKTANLVDAFQQIMQKHVVPAVLKVAEGTVNKNV